MKQDKALSEHGKTIQAGASPKLKSNLVLSVAVWPVVGGLIGFFSFGWYAVAPSMILVLGSITLASETIKTQLGGLAEAAFEDRRYLRGSAFILAAFACVAWGVVSGCVAIEALGEPQRQYAAARSVVESRQAKLDALTAQILSLPQPTATMPRVRIEAMTASNQEAREALSGPVADAKADLKAAKTQLAQMKDPGPSLPKVDLWVKALVSLFAEYLVFAVPWANKKAPERRAKKPSKVEVKAPAPAPKVNDGGWSTRRARYGDTGRRSSPVLQFS